MVISNWAILAVLTSVVSDNMMSASHLVCQEEAEISKQVEQDKFRRKLMAIFHQVDPHGSGYIDSTAWRHLMNDVGSRSELCETTGMHAVDLEAYFESISMNAQERALALEDQKKTIERDRTLDYVTFIQTLQEDGGSSADKRLMNLAAQLRHVQNRMLDLHTEIHDSVPPYNAPPSE